MHMLMIHNSVLMLHKIMLIMQRNILKMYLPISQINTTSFVFLKDIEYIISQQIKNRYLRYYKKIYITYRVYK
jgi:hypothetical protein